MMMQAEEQLVPEQGDCMDVDTPTLVYSTTLASHIVECEPSFRVHTPMNGLQDHERLAVYEPRVHPTMLRYDLCNNLQSFANDACRNIQKHAANGRHDMLPMPSLGTYLPVGESRYLDTQSDTMSYQHVIHPHKDMYALPTIDGTQHSVASLSQFLSALQHAAPGTVRAVSIGVCGFSWTMVDASSEAPICLALSSNDSDKSKSASHDDLGRERGAMRTRAAAAAAAATASSGPCGAANGGDIMCRKRHSLLPPADDHVHHRMDPTTPEYNMYLTMLDGTCYDADAGNMCKSQYKQLSSQLHTALFPHLPHLTRVSISLVGMMPPSTGYNTRYYGHRALNTTRLAFIQRMLQDDYRSLTALLARVRNAHGVDSVQIAMAIMSPYTLQILSPSYALGDGNPVAAATTTTMGATAESSSLSTLTNHRASQPAFPLLVYRAPE